MTAIRMIIAAALITGAALKAVPALAAPASGDSNVRIVRTADLDLSSDSGRRALDHRLVVAAYEVCGTASDVDLAGKNKARACRDTVLADARTQGEQLASRGDRVPIKLAAR